MENPENVLNMAEGPESDTGPESNESLYRIFENVVFSEIKDRRGRVTGYKSSDPSRKIIEIAATASIEQGVPYTVRITEDTKPEDPMSGKYIGEIVVEAAGATGESPRTKQEIESNLNKAELSERAARKSRVELYEQTGLQAAERESKDKEEIIRSSKRPRVTEKALDREERLTKEAEELLGDEGSAERVVLSLRYKNLIQALRQEKELEDEIEKLRAEESEILKESEDELSGSVLEALTDIRAEIQQAETEKKNLYNSSPEAFYGLHLKELKSYKEDLETGRIVETPYVQEHIDDIVAHLRANKPVMVYGHLGSGKTELALHVARNYILQDRPDIDQKIGKDFESWLQSNPGANPEEQEKYRKELDISHRSALVISGSKNMSISELYGHQVLTVDKATGATVSDYFLGPIYQAMEEGRPVIIDEVNAIPHEVLISLNHILTRRPGDEVNVQQDSGRAITIKDGYGIIMTGNLNQGQTQYIDRQDMDPAFLSRLYKLEYDYLPQSTEGYVTENIEGNELYQLLISRVMDKHGNIEAPIDTPDKLWDLAKAARITQNVFAGKEANAAYYFKEAGGRGPGIQYMLKESVLSLRNIDRIITQWQKEGYKYELDYYVYKEFIGQSTTASDKAYLYQLFKDQFGFFAGGEWEQNPDYGRAGNITAFDIKVPKIGASEIHFFGPRDTVKFAFGADDQERSS
jgi:MoxR-like ATPase